MSFAIEEVSGKASNLLKNKAFLMIAAGVGVVALIAGRRRSQDQTATDTAEVAFADYPQAPANYQQDLEQYKTVIENEMSQAFSELWNQVQQSQSDLQNQVKQSQADLQNQTTQQLQQLASSFQSSLADIQQHSTLNGSTLTQTIQDLQSSYQSSLQSTVQNMVEQNKALMELVIDNAAPKQTQQPAPTPTTPVSSNPVATKPVVTPPKPTTPSKPVVTKPVVTPPKPDPKQQLIDKIDNSKYSGPSIVDYLKGAGVDASLANRAKIAQQLGIKNYTGTAAQNTQMLNMLRSDDKKKK